MAPIVQMIGGNGKTSYANNSLLQQEAISTTWPITEEAITNMYCGTGTLPETLCIADLGCCSGPNAFLVVSQIIKTIDTLCVKFGREKLPEFQVYFNDLPENDFNSIFRLLPEFKKSLKKQYRSRLGPCFFSGVPCSFYERILQASSVHFVHSSYGVHWLSKVPVVAESNKRNIYLSPTTPSSVVKAYYEQFEKDFLKFLENRVEEIVPRGCMVLTFVGRISDDAKFSKEACFIWELLAMTLNQMVIEGSIEEEKLDCFNIPYYTASEKEVQYLIEKEGSFVIDRLEVSKVKWTGYDVEHCSNDKFKNGGQFMANCIRAVLEPMLVNQFGDKLMDEVFARYSEILDIHMAEEKSNKTTNITVSLTKKIDVV